MNQTFEQWWEKNNASFYRLTEAVKGAWDARQLEIDRLTRERDEARAKVERAEKLYKAARSLDLTQISYAADAYRALPPTKGKP